MKFSIGAVLVTALAVVAAAPHPAVASISSAPGLVLKSARVSVSVSREAGRTLLVSGKTRIPLILPNLDSTESMTPWGKTLPVRSKVVERASKSDGSIPRRSILGRTPQGSFVIPIEEAVGGYELWNGLGLLYVARDPMGDVVGFGTFGTMACEDDAGGTAEIITVRGEGQRLIWWERPGEITIPGNSIPFMDQTGSFISFIPVSEGEGLPSVAEAAFESVGTRSSRLPTGDPIKPGLEKYGKSVETAFFSNFGYEVFGRVRPWSHYMEKGDNILIRRSQRLRVTFKGNFSQNFYVFKSDKPDSTGLISWFSGTTAYSNRSIFVPVEGGFYYSFCAECPKTQKVKIEWDDSI